MIDIGLYNKDQLFNEEIEFRQRYEKKYKIISSPLLYTDIGCMKQI